MDTTILKKAVYSLDQHKAMNVTALCVEGLTAITDYFLIASGGSTTQVRALADYLEEELGMQGIRPLRSEGYETGDWISIDYGDVIVHLFRDQVREFYDLEHLWKDAAPVDIAPYTVQEG